MMRRFVTLMTFGVCCCFAYSQQSMMNKRERYAVLEHFDECKHVVFLNAEDAYAELCLKYHVESKDSVYLSRLLTRREWHKCAHNFLDSVPTVRVREKMRIDSLYQDSIDALLIPFNHQISGKSISLALQLSEHFKLSNRKHRLLMDKALAFARMKRRNPLAWFAKEEMDVMKKVLTRKQIEIVLNEKNSLDARVKACKIWNDLEKAGLSEELDSAGQMFLLEKYFTLDMFYRDYFVGDDVTMKNNLDDLYRQRPRGIKMHEAMNTRRQIEAEAKEEKKKKVGDAFAW